MRCLLFIAVCLLRGSAMAAAQNEQREAVEIPLKEIWALEMPGTRDIRRLEKNRPPTYSYGPLIQDIGRALAQSPKRTNGLAPVSS
jgi:hypothetical protein